MTNDKLFYKQFFSIYWVLVLHNVIVLFVNLADNIMIGAYSETSLAGIAAVNQIQFIFQQTIMGCGNGLVVIGSQYWGQGRTNEVKRISVCALLIGTITSIALFICASVTPAGIMKIFTPSEHIINEGVSYIKIIKYTYVIFAFTNILLAMLRCVETVKIGFYISVITLIINCSINYVLIEGRFGAPQLGAEGAAIGTLVARVIEFIVVLCYIVFKENKLNCNLKDIINFDKILFGDYCKVSITIILVAGMFGFSTALQSVILGHMSDNAIAANSMSSSLYQVLKVAAIGAASAASIIIGKTIGSDDINKLKEYTRTLQFIFIFIGALTTLILFIIRIPVLSMYELTPETKELANGFILVLCVTGFGTAYQMPVLCGIVQGGGDSKFILKNDIISIWCIVIPVSFMAAFWFEWHPIAVVFCLNADQIFKCCAAAIKVNSYTWIKKLTRNEI